MASGISPTFEVQMEDGTTYEVKADQRDSSAYERSDVYTENGIHTRVRYMAWNALRRTKQTQLQWNQFDDLCVDAFTKTDEFEEVDPTQTDQSHED